ncbi:putative fimbrial-like adhesin protein [Escherichia coli]|nr:hypothetical protein A8M31_00765 [Escherichia coli]SQN37804.1 putative fimbrial-like adhesin protein [Escherichia coli]SQN95275.1 putative fimbrial-like adhesin protein [Escherichia coli]SQO00524.1 putative fimbrial-like adhesin protein [Escherichia coli]
MMSLWDALRMNMMISYQELVRTFPNEISSGASNVGVVIFSTQDSANTFNVLNASGGSRSVYPVMSDDMNGSSWKFSTRMQKIDPALSVTSGQLMSHVLVDIYYE